MTMNRVLTLLACATAGISLFLIVYNRLLNIRDGIVKVFAIRLSFVLCVLAPILMGLLSNSPWVLMISGTALVMVSIGEFHRISVRSKCQASPPVESRNISVALTKPVTEGDLAVLRFEIQAPDWHQGTDLRIVLLSDLHLDGDDAVRYLREVFEQVMSWTPDVILIGGDFISEGRFASLIPETLRALHARLGVYSILGNHDHWTEPERVADNLAQTQVQLLGLTPVRLPVDEHHSIILCGDERPWVVQAPAVPARQANEMLLVLSHTGDNIYWWNRAGAFAVFSGHYHAGQVRLPGIGSLVIPSCYGRRFDHGHFLVRGTHLFVTAGLGSTPPPRRFYCKPDYFIVDIHGSRARDETDAVSTSQERI